MTSVIDLASYKHGNLALKLSDQPLMNWTQKLLDLTDPNKADSEWLHEYRRKNLPNIMRGINKVRIAEEHGIMMPFGMLYMKKWDIDKETGLMIPGTEMDYGLVSCRVVTTAGVNFIVSAFQNSVEPETMRYHGVGTTNTAENVADTALAAECTTVLNPDSTRATGTLGTGATANVFRTVGTNTFDGSATIVEHGVLSQAATGGGTLIDRSVFAGIGISSGNALQATYDLTFTAGS